MNTPAWTMAIAMTCLGTAAFAQTVATPATLPGDLPAIHMPGQYGAIAGKPFLLTIAATGQAPIAYAADGLPKGLALDAATGIISGSIAKDGTFNVNVTATNAAGNVSAVVPIVAGSTQALTPPLGWNSYDGYGDNVTEDEILANAKAVEKFLKPHGWQYVVVDYRWYDPGAHDNDALARADADLTMDANGRLLPAPNRFASAAKGVGFKALADKIHAMGLRFGIHIMRGIPQQAVKANSPIDGSSFTAADAADKADVCTWCHDMYGVNTDAPAAIAWYDSIFRQYASWGVDYVKVDDLSRPYASKEIEMIRDSIDKCGRAIVFSASPGATPTEDADHISQNANLWRITDDFWDSWTYLNPMFNTAASWLDSAGPGHWPDADMLPLGRLSVSHRSVGNDRQTQFTRPEQTTMLTLWSLMPAPLMVGGDFTRADDWELSLLTNDQVLAIDQDASGKPAVRATPAGGGRGAGGPGGGRRGGPGGGTAAEYWTKALSDGSIAVGIFNRSANASEMAVTFANLGIKGRYHVTDVWAQKPMPDATDRLQADIPSHGAALLRLRPIN